MCRTTTHYYGHGDGDIDPFTHHNWPRLERCKCNYSLDGHVAVSDKVNNEKTVPPIMALVRNNNKEKKKHRINKLKLLEDIPEDKELRIDDDNNGADGDVYANPEVEEALEMDLEVLRRAFDMGIWVVCLGLGFMFSRANFRPPPTFS